jgi:penicillin-binding protein 1A
VRVVRLVLGLGLLASVGVGAVSLATGLAVVENYSRDLPDHRALATYVPKTGSEILAADGSLLSKRTDQRRTFVAIGSIPPLVKQAFISAEDRSYLTHQGVDLLAVARAAVGHASGASSSGGSTITQQVAKNLLVGNERSVVRKVREALLAMRMDKDLGKDRVLEIYLNEIYLGLGAYGVAEAAQTYFGKSLDALTVGEAALLAGMPKAPSSYNPVRNPSRALERRNYVLRRMAEDGAIDVVTASAAIGQPIRLAERKHSA